MSLPGLSAVVERPPAPPEPLRTDIAVLAGRTARGPVGQPTAIAGWREYLGRFGGLIEHGVTPYSVRAYFDNGGEIAWIVRVEAETATTATGQWTVGSVDGSGQWEPTAPGQGGFTHSAFHLEATSPGSWANGTRVVFTFRAAGLTGDPELDIAVFVPDEAPEYFGPVQPALVEETLGRSRYVTIRPDGAATTPPPSATGPRTVTWSVLLAGGDDAVGTVADYLTAVDLIADQEEPALVCLPDLATDLAVEPDRDQVVARLVSRCAETLDRLALLDAPDGQPGADRVLDWVNHIRVLVLGDPALHRAVAVYHPPLSVIDPLGSTARPLRVVPPSGAVAGMISRLDRGRGAHHTPANATLFDVVDVAELLDEPSQVLLHTTGVNNLRCTPGRGLEVWGGRTLDRDPYGLFVAHRRLVHRLVRAIRRVAEPLVFDVNGPELWLTLVRAITTVLLEAFRSGGLQGRIPDEAFRVQCDEELNPPESRDDGRVLCLVSLAPATPMEFIVLRLSFGLQGTLEVVEQ